ncbi:MAG: hypothetical protein LBR62_00505 [Puniceicoccales bacterium]|nr:hypothetical protein [Puniceicoccales bacterium]
MYGVCSGRLRYQNGLLLLASYIFYGSWNWKFLFLLWFSTMVDFVAGRKIEACGPGNLSGKRFWLWLSVAINLGLLGFFKYFHFFAHNAVGLLSLLGLQVTIPPFFQNIILPVGISFYTFQTMCYTIDVYRGRIRAEHDFLSFSLYVSFFPQLVAGPIERAGALLPQITHPRTLTRENFLLGARFFLFGCFKKLVIGDNAGVFVDRVFRDLSAATPWEILFLLHAFWVQVYCDFSGYSDMAVGSAKILGFSLTENFNSPFFSSTVGEFWRRWHISLSSWLRDYLYVPLVSGRGRRLWIRGGGLLITFALCGLWHGANWTFVVWGVYNGLLMMVELLFKIKASSVRWVRGVQILLTLHLLLIGMCLFRSPSLREAFLVLKKAGMLFSREGWVYFSPMEVAKLVIISFVPITLLEFLEAKTKYFERRWPIGLQISMYLSWLYAISFFKVGDGELFMYFQF